MRVALGEGGQAVGEGGQAVGEGGCGRAVGAARGGSLYTVIRLHSKTTDTYTRLLDLVGEIRTTRGEN